MDATQNPWMIHVHEDHASQRVQTICGTSTTVQAHVLKIKDHQHAPMSFPYCVALWYRSRCMPGKFSRKSRVGSREAPKPFGDVL